jgi:endonuclease YncB( thermonuclease family)
MLRKCIGHCILGGASTSTPKFSLKGRYTGKVVDVYDGDTVQVVILVWGQARRFTLRINGIDAPEIRSNDNLEKEQAILVRDRTRAMILGAIVTVIVIDFDKYGRLLGDIEYGSARKKISEELLDNNLVIKYQGGKKIPWRQWYRPALLSPQIREILLERSNSPGNPEILGI